MEPTGCDLTGLTGLTGAVLAGGTGRRLGGVDKALLRLGTGTLLQRAADTLRRAGCSDLLLLGPGRDGETSDLLPLPEDPLGGGPAAALLTAVEWTARQRPTHVLVVLAVDMPGVEPTTVQRLLAALGSHDAAFLTSPDQRTHLAAALHPARCRAAWAEQAAPATGTGRSIRSLLASLDVCQVPATAAEAHDVDDPADLARWQITLPQHPG